MCTVAIHCKCMKNLIKSLEIVKITLKVYIILYEVVLDLNVEIFLFI